VVAGDSAGGNLALCLMQRLRDAGQPLPAAAALFSPAVDLTGESPSLTRNAQRDAMFAGGDALRHLADAYLAGADAGQPLASPLRGDLRGLPPVLLHVGADEALRDDSVRLADALIAAGGVAQLRVWPGVAHVWQMVWRLPEARQSVAQAAAFLRQPPTQATPEALDVVVIGAGLSGIGAAATLQQRCPDQRLLILEARAALGGTWDLFRYPGVRSDSDMHTLGYGFKPWTEPQAIAEGGAIRRYIAETAAERGLTALVRYGHRLRAARWSSADAQWHLDIDRGPAQPPLALRTRILHLCCGYYRYDQGHSPVFEGQADFRGRVVHPQAWPADLDHAGQRVVVIGSGATAVTLVPAMARTAAHVTMLQRSPTWVLSLPARDAIGQWLQRWLPARWAYRLVRGKNIALGLLFFQLARRRPGPTGQHLLGLVRRQLPAGYDVATHFTPRYKPWDQRLCVVPDGDLFKAIRSGRAEVVTDQIQRFTAQGLQLASGRQLAADIVVTATGLQLNVLGDVAVSVDGRACDFSQTLAYKGMMFSGVPNLLYTFGYTNAAWTLKADLTADYLCRLIQHLQRHRLAVAVPLRDAQVRPAPFLDFSSGYVQRALAQLPKQGDCRPWRLVQNYLLDLLMLRYGRLADGTLHWAAAGQPLPTMPADPHPAGTPR